MGKGKLKKFAELDTFANVFQNLSYTEPQLFTSGKQQIEPKGKWSNKIFKNENDILLELACGKGEYTLALAEKYPNQNFYWSGY